MQPCTSPYAIQQMFPADDFSIYEAFISQVMKPEDYYTAAELKRHILSGYVSAWWVRDATNTPIGWCGLNHYNRKRAGCWNLLGVAVAESHRNTTLALRLIRHLMRHGDPNRDASVYIQPGTSTEKLLKPYGFQYAGHVRPWNLYIRKAPQT